MTTTATHTAASLALLPERELDALAAEIVMGYVWRTRATGTEAGKYKFLCAANSFYGNHPGWVEPNGPAELYGDATEEVPHYSTSRAAAALLEQALAERGVAYRRNAAEWLFRVLNKEVDYGISIFDVCAAMDASAKSRTIAAILAAQEAK